MIEPAVVHDYDGRWKLSDGSLVTLLWHPCRGHGWYRWESATGGPNHLTARATKVALMGAERLATEQQQAAR